MPDEPEDLPARLQQLEERLAAEPADPPAEPASTPPASRSAAPRAPRKATPAVATPAKKPAAKKAAAKRAPAKKAAGQRATGQRAAAKVAVPDLGSGSSGPWPVSQAPLPPPGGAPRSAAPPLPATAAGGPPTSAPVVPPARERDRVVRLLLALAVLLLAVAAGLGAAALVEHRASTYSAATVVRLDPGPDPSLPIDDTITAGAARYLTAASSHAFTATAEQRSAVAASEVPQDAQAVQRAPRQLTLTVYARTAKDAAALATGAGDAFVELVNLQEVVDQTSPGDRLAAVVVGPDGGAVKTAPQDRDAWVAGLLAGGAVLVLAGVGALVRLTRRP